MSAKLSLLTVMRFAAFTFSFSLLVIFINFISFGVAISLLCVCCKFATQNYGCFLVFSLIFAVFVIYCLVSPLQAPKNIVRVGLQVDMTSYYRGHVQKRLEITAPLPVSLHSGP